MQKDTNFVEHLSHLLMNINQKVIEDKENLQNLNVQQFSQNLKVQRKIEQKIKPEIKFEKTAQTFDITNEENPLQNFEFVNNEILPIQGVSFSKTEAKQINNALKYFRKTENKNFEFFGKIFGTQKDYYIIFSNDPKKLNQEENEKDNLNIPKHWENQGVNKFDFRVLLDEFNQWKKLDLISPKQLRQSRNINIYFSGDLTKNLTQNGFEGTEENYLKCQLVRILSACYCVPSNYYKFEETIKDIEVDQEAMKDSFQTRESISNTENWVHRFPIILKSGRLKHFIPLHRNEEDREQLKDELDENDPNCDRLRALNEDTENLWKFKYYGQKEFYTVKNNEDEEQQKQIGNVVLTNNNWKGAMNIYSINHQISSFFYLGWGFKNPLLRLENQIEQFQFQPKQKLEQEEPNHYEEPEPEKEDEENDSQQQDEQSQDQNKDEEEQIQDQNKQEDQQSQQQDDQQEEETNEVNQDNQQNFNYYQYKKYGQCFIIRN